MQNTELSNIHIETTGLATKPVFQAGQHEWRELIPVGEIELYEKGRERPFARSRGSAVLDYDFAKSARPISEAAELEVCVTTTGVEAIINIMSSSKF